MMRKKTTFGFAVTCILIAAVIAFVAGYFIAGSKVKEITEPTGSSSSSGYELLDEVKKVVSENYMGSADENELVKGICKGYVEGLGDNAVKYMTADEYASYSKEAVGETILYKNYGKGVGYIQFTSFTSSTKQSFTDAIGDLSSSSATSKVNMLVLDLRNCSTGDIEVVAGLLDLILPEGETVAGIDKDGERVVLYTSDSNELDYDIAVLVNGNTSGAAEIFAATLGVYNKAIIVGTTTAGDCARTDAITLSNGDYILIPNLYYVTKGQQSYSNTGVVPTNVVEMSATEQKAYDSGTLEISNDPQFLAAVKALGVNDVPTVSSDTDTSSTSSKTSSDTDTNTDSDSASRGNSSDTVSSEYESSTNEDDDPYWDDPSYWENYSENNNNYEDDEDEYWDDYDYDYDYDYGYDDYDYGYNDYGGDWW